MPELFITARAELDLGEIVLFVGESNPDAALSLFDEIRGAAARLTRGSAVGHRHRDVPEPRRVYRVGHWLIIYELTESPLRVDRVIHASRDLPRLRFPRG